MIGALMAWMGPCCALAAVWRCALILGGWLAAAWLSYTVGKVGHHWCTASVLAFSVLSLWGQWSVWRMDALVACSYFHGNSVVVWRGVLLVECLWPDVVVSVTLCRLLCCEHVLALASCPGERSVPLHCAVLCP